MYLWGINWLNKAIKHKNSKKLIDTINAYAKLLDKAALLSPHTKEIIGSLASIDGIKAIKGCGAMGADILLVITDKTKTQAISRQIQTQLELVATTDSLYNIDSTCLI